MQSASISYRTYALDLWGFGDTAKVRDNYPLEQQVNLLDQFLQEMGIARIALIGHGLGAIVAIMFASKFQRKIVDRVMAISLPNGQQPLNQRLYDTSPTELADWLLGRTGESEAVRLEASKADQLAIQQALSSVGSMNISNLTYQLSTPCLLVNGQNDPITETSSSQDPPIDQPDHIHQISFEQSGHFPMLDEANKFNRLLADFLALTSGTSPRQLQIKEEWKRRVR